MALFSVAVVALTPTNNEHGSSLFNFIFILFLHTTAPTPHRVLGYAEVYFRPLLSCIISPSWHTRGIKILNVFVHQITSRFVLAHSGAVLTIFCLVY